MCRKLNLPYQCRKQIMYILQINISSPVDQFTTRNQSFTFTLGRPSTVNLSIEDVYATGRQIYVKSKQTISYTRNGLYKVYM
jgi:hypothetical protein